MAEGEQDDESKTEEPTHKRLEEAVKKGNIPVSKEVGSFLMLLALAFTVAVFAPSILRNAKILLTPFISDFATLPGDGKELGLLFRNTVFSAAAILLAPILASIVAALLGSFLQNGLMFSGESLIPKLNKISPMAGLKRLFSMRSVVEFIKI